MSEMVTAAVEAARIVAGVQKEKARYAYLSESRRPAATTNRQTTPTAPEETLPDVKLENSTTRTQVEGGTHVLVVEHKEYLEKVPEPFVPPTPEELAQAREDKRFVTRLWAGVAAVGIVVVGVVVAVERTRKPVAELSSGVI